MAEEKRPLESEPQRHRRPVRLTSPVPLPRTCRAIFPSRCMTALPSRTPATW